MQRLIFAIIFMLSCSSDYGPPPVGSATLLETGSGDTSASGTTSGTASTTAGTGSASASASGTTATTADTSGSATSTTGTASGSSSDGGASSGGGSSSDGGSSSTGVDLCPEWALYQCHGWVAGLYLNGGVGTNYQFYNLPGGANEFVCIDDIYICAPWMDEVDTDYLFDACTEACEAQNWVWPASHGTWLYAGTWCTFDHDGNAGYIEAGSPYGEPGIASCPWVDQNPPVDQVTYVRECVNSECASFDCTPWATQKANNITSSFSIRTWTYSTTMKKPFFWGLFDQAGDLYGCDTARWDYAQDAAGADVMTMKDVQVGDLAYRMGFRTGDYALTIRKAGTGNPTYLLNNFLQVSDAYDALKTSTTIENPAVDTLLVLTFKRPTTGGGYQTHTMNLTMRKG